MSIVSLKIKVTVVMVIAPFSIVLVFTTSSTTGNTTSSISLVGRRLELPSSELVHLEKHKKERKKEEEEMTVARKKEDFGSAQVGKKERMVAPGFDLHSQFYSCYCLTIPAVASKSSKI